MSFDKEKFAKLLNKAKGNRSINQFALHTGISAAHISRLMRGLLDTPPNPDTIKSLADKAYNEVTYNDLMIAAGHLASNLNDEHNENKQNDYDSLAEINKIIEELGIENVGFFDIEKWKNLSPEDVEEIRKHFEWVAHRAKERNEENKLK